MSKRVARSDPGVLDSYAGFETKISLTVGGHIGFRRKLNTVKIDHSTIKVH